MAEYTNMNFLSENSSFKPQFYFPNIKDCIVTKKAPPANTGTLSPRKYVSTTPSHPGEQIEHLAVRSYLDYFRDVFIDLIVPEEVILDREQSLYYMDENCHEDYAAKLIPRAIGYSADLLDYFFRGRLDIRHPFVKIATDGTEIFIGGFEFEVKNDSMIGDVEEALEKGSFDLAYRYTPGRDETSDTPDNETTPDEDDNETMPVYGVVGPESILNKTNGLRYEVSSADDDINAQYVRLSVDLPPEKYIPLNATDVSFTLVFSGTLGHEKDTAVAVGSYRFGGKTIDNHSRLAFSYQNRYQGPSNISMVCPDGTDLRNLTQLPETPEETTDTWYFAPAWSPDGKWLAYEKEFCGTLQNEPDPIRGTNWQCDLETMERNIQINDFTAGPFDANAPDRLLRYPITNFEGYTPECRCSPAAALLQPTFSPQGTSVACMMSRPETYGTGFWLAIFNPVTGQGGFINGHEDTGGNKPVWSPDGLKIAYFVDDQSSYIDESPLDIFTINPVFSSDGNQVIAGVGKTNLTQSPGVFDADPSWSPDSQWIVFISNRDGGQFSDIWIMDKNGQNAHKIFEAETYCKMPCFSPDGTSIAFIAGTNIYAIDLAGGNRRALTNNTDPHHLINELAWSPYLDEYAPAVTLIGDQTNIDAGQTVRLTWTSTGADRIVLDNGIGEQTELDGDIDVNPEVNTTYTISAYNWAGKATASVEIAVSR
ncbi:MAG: PD40 domain-containing protein [Desulfobacterales bacterium]|nr:PD40 domain-containing protein [Desulfobacterales bacterium]